MPALLSGPATEVDSLLASLSPGTAAPPTSPSPGTASPLTSPSPEAADISSSLQWFGSSSLPPRAVSGLSGSLVTATIILVCSAPPAAVIWRRATLRRTFYLYVLTLCLLDCLFAAVVITSTVTAALLLALTGGVHSGLCLVFEVLLNGTMNAVSLMMLALARDRFLSVNNALTYPLMASAGTVWRHAKMAAAYGVMNGAMFVAARAYNDDLNKSQVFCSAFIWLLRPEYWLVAVLSAAGNIVLDLGTLVFNVRVIYCATKLLVASCWGQVDSLSPQCASCVTPGQCSTPLSSGGIRTNCTLPSGQEGVCCEDGDRLNSALLAPPAEAVNLREAQWQATQHLDALAELEERLAAVLHRPGAEQADMMDPLPEGSDEDSMLMQQLGRLGLERFLTIQAINNQTMLLPGCESPELDVPCGDVGAENRSLSGDCNHPESPFLGRALTGLGRLTGATYEDHLFFEPRSLASDGSPLPPAALVGSLVAHQPLAEPLSRWASTLSEFIGLDLARTAPFRLEDGREPDCCTEHHPACLPLHMDTSCVNFVRLLPAQPLDCVMRPAAPLSEASAYLDLEMVYGGSAVAGRRLRTFQGGRLRADRGRQQQQRELSLDNDLFAGSEGHLRLRSHYGAPQTSWSSPRGSYRGSASLFRPRRLPAQRHTLEVSSDQLHQILLREHNRVADAVRRNHRDWEDERIFQLARRVVIAEWQHIIYREYLPHVLGAAAGQRLSRATSLDDDPTVNVEFAAAAFRFWQRSAATAPAEHEDSKSRRRSFLDAVQGLAAASGFSRRLQKGGGGQTNSEPAEEAAAHVLRGRELGLPTFADVRELCTGTNVSVWSDLEGVVPQPELGALQSVYGSPRDIDLWVGGVLEGRAPAARVGPTFQCIIEEQFRRARDGDRFFYDRALSGAQLAEVQKASLARLLCDNQPGGRDGVLPLVLEPISAHNKMTLCTAAAIPRVNLDVF
ncbi:Chorion peroxidase [Amphibalanus amphitrite]|uniref:Chorion peroxidase n=1 Tax=Amphibalanus amphitrite TaxID=1232801 RepID=A0A6A4VMZ1_AMPAM|nr:Chorion peroxidase [Amphibalanus amphitrite]